MDNWNVIRTFTNPQDAHMAKAYLESLGINAMIEDELVQMYNFAPNAAGGVKLLIRDQDWEAGVLFLSDGGYIYPADLVPDDEIQIVDRAMAISLDACPFCYSENISKQKNPDVIIRTAYALLGVVFPMFRAPRKCSDCGKVWKYKR